MKRLLTAGAAAILMMLALPAVSDAATSDYPPAPTTGTSTETTTVGAGGLGALVSQGWRITSVSNSVVTVTLNNGGAATVLVNRPVAFTTGPVFQPGEPVFVLVRTVAPGFRTSHSAFAAAAGSSPASVTADASGSATVALTPTDPGTYRLTLTGATSGESVTSTITVKAASAVTTAAAGGLSYTGVNGTMITFGAIGGGLALVIGAGLVWLGATKRRAPAHHA